MTALLAPRRFAAATPRPLTLRLTLLLAAYGLLVGVYGVHHWAGGLPKSSVALQTSRQGSIREAIDVLDQGGPPLVASTIPYKQALTERQVVRADATDDPGIYVYLPLIGHWTGDRDPLSLLRWFSFVLMALALVAYPVLFYLLFDSLLLALAAPLALLFDVGYAFYDIYFIESWAVLLLLPTVFVVAKLKWRRRRSLATLAAVAFLASFASSIRAQAGAGVVLAALAVAVWRERGWRWRAGAAGVVLVAYLLVTPLAIDGIRAYSDSVAHPVGTRAGHPVWHGAYIGLGLLPNRWGIQWNDTVSANAVAKVDPQAAYLSPRYEAILRHLYFRIVLHDPVYVAHVYSLKAAIVLRGVWHRFWPGLVLAPIVLVVGRRRRRFRREFLLVVPALLGALVPPVLTVPYGYDNGFVGAIGLLALLSACGVYLLAREGVAAWPDLGLPVRRFARGLAIAATGATLIAAVGLGSTSYAHAESRELNTQLQSSLVVDPSLIGAVVQRWTPRQIVDWKRTDDNQFSLQPTGTVDLLAKSGAQPELDSPPVLLQPGSYIAVANGDVRNGGLQVQAYDPNEGEPLAVGYYWHGQVDFSSKRMIATFTLTEPTRIEVHLDGWPLAPGTPTWSLRSVELARAPA